MVICYSQTDSFSAALEKTFDGEHPCKMCKLIKQGRKAEKEKPPMLKVETKFDLFLEAPCLTVYAPKFLREPYHISFQRPSRRDPPLLRPPIFV